MNQKSCRANDGVLPNPVRDTLGSNLGPMTSKQGTKSRYKTQDQPKRTNSIALVSLPRAQGVRGSNPRAPTKSPKTNIAGVA
jgi:hypothetical protein